MPSFTQERQHTAPLPPMSPSGGRSAETFTSMAPEAKSKRAAGDELPEKAPSDSLRRPLFAGSLIVLLFFGGLGCWAFTAPLNGAVVATGVVKVEGNRKSVQHLDGGIVKELRVKEGDKVNSGDIVLLLDDSQARAEFEVLSQQFLMLRATEERLKAELNRTTFMRMPADLAGYANNADLDVIWSAQVNQLNSRLQALQGARSVIREKIAQLEHQIAGAEGTLKSYRAQIDSVRAEMEAIRPLVDKKLIARPRYLQLERSGIQLEGQAADTQAAIAKAKQAIAEQTQQLAQFENDRMTEVTRDLLDTQAKLLEAIPKLSNAKSILGRMRIQTPYTGRVVGLNMFSVGGVVGRGEKIMEIVPAGDSLIIEAQVAVEDISDVHPDMRAEVHLTAYKQRITPMVNGQVLLVSADRLTDQKTGQPYFAVILRVDPKELEGLPNIQLYPGMPAQVIIPTVERTAFDYLVGPLVQSLNHSFRQR